MKLHVELIRDTIFFWVRIGQNRQNWQMNGRREVRPAVKEPQMKGHLTVNETRMIVEHRSDGAWGWCVDLCQPLSSTDKHLSLRDLVLNSHPSSVRCSRACLRVESLPQKCDNSGCRRLPQLTSNHSHNKHNIAGFYGRKRNTGLNFRCVLPHDVHFLYDTIRYDTIEEFNVDSKAEYTDSTLYIFFSLSLATFAIEELTII